MDNIIAARFDKGELGYEMIYRGSKYEVTNWHLLPEEKIVFRDSEDTIVKGKIRIWYDKEDFEDFDQTMNLADLDTLRGAQKLHPEAGTMLNITQLPAFKAFLNRQIRKSKCKTRYAVKTAGIVLEDNKRIYCSPNKTTGTVIALPEESTQATLRTSLLVKNLKDINVGSTVNMLLETHHEYVPLLILSWCVATMAKRFSKTPVRNPILFSYGRHNTGKTALHKKLIGNFFYMISPAQEKDGHEESTMFNLSGQTLPTLQRHASLSNLHPLMLDEFKYQGDESLRVMLSDFLRNNYDEADVQKAIDSSGKMNTYRNVRPVSITGESTFKNEGAIINRSLIVRHRAFTQEHEDKHNKFNWKVIRNLGQMVLKHLLEQQEVEWATLELKDYRAKLDTRNVDTINFLWNGVKILNDVAGETVISEERFRHSVDTYVSHILLEDISDVEEIFSSMESYFIEQQHRLNGLNKEYMFLKENELYISFRPFVQWFERYNLPSTRQDLSERLIKVGMIRYEHNPPKELKGFSLIFRLNYEEFARKINMLDYPNVFKLLDIQKKIITNLNYEDF